MAGLLDGISNPFYKADGTLDQEYFNKAVSDAREQIALEYPVLGRAQKGSIVGYAPSSPYGDDNSLEYYPAKESYNPKYGQDYQEVYDRLLQSPQDGSTSLKNALGADVIHALTGRNDAGEYNDPTYMGLQHALEGTFTPRDIGSNERTWAKSQGNWGGSKQDWMDISRTPSYVRGALFGQWKNDDGSDYTGDTPEQIRALQAIKGYLTGKSGGNY